MSDRKAHPARPRGLTIDVTRAFHLVPLIVLLGLGCRSAPVSWVKAEHTTSKSYVLNEERTAVPGSPMLAVREGNFLPNFIALEPLEATGLRPVPRGLQWIARHDYHGACGDGRYVITNSAWYRATVGFIVNANGALPCEYAVLEVRPPRFLKNSGRTWSVGGLAEKRVFTPLEGYPVSGKRLMKQELIFNGRSESTVFILYREYVDDLARPSFFQELRYDLNDSSRIIFREWELNVIKASNQGIQFEIVRD
jgi:hypothetical protein